ncbi:uncharacterized protein LOC123515818 isoform X2 [Portunus trituberculatus]|uniref:uncharacterized protein LOC123515818 isoform X2 n=1 Tax=Portunus trituberculatus TaxID=210409 RepID=UPI001E1D14C1|nr:uncharacterized protein LOC123515818 isoform X2 [Portunus trituberculatus]
MPQLSTSTLQSTKYNYALLLSQVCLPQCVMSRNQAPAVIYFFALLLTGCAAEDKQCEVLKVDARAVKEYSSFVYNITYKDPFCANKGELTRKLRSCNTTDDSDPNGEPVEGKLNPCHEGNWMVTMSANVNSNCFSCPGLYLNHYKVLSFTYDSLTIEMKDVSPTVKNWNLTIYKTTTETDYKVCSARHGLGYIKKLFQKTDLKANITLSLVTLKHSFDPNACYCFVMNPISNVHVSPENILFTTKTCKPTPPSPERGTELIASPPMSMWEKIGWGVLAGVVLCFVAMIVVVISSPAFIAKILRLKGVIDISDSQDLKILKKNLQASFTVYDLFDRNNLDQLADQSGWTEKMLLPTSGVKMLLVESAVMHERIASLLDSDKESSMNAMLAKKSLHERTAENLLTFALRTIIACLREDYSSVFVIRFTDEVKDGVFFLVQMRRYKLPDHFSELSKDIKEAKRMSVW